MSGIKLSIIIVNYNVEYFLEQCINSCLKAMETVPCELFVVDNNSIDGSVDMVRAKFPQVHLIANKENLGFSKANNQAMRLANGEYLLLLNPDTVLEEDTFVKVVEFMDAHPDAGGLGVRMLDGKGKFLPESKRGLPTPAVAFFKIFGISKLFPKSRLFGRYHLGYLDEFETNEIEILSGAFMLMRKEALDKVGLLDEAFFMYGEDIDLSYRIVLGGYKNYYFPETRIIHYKGESTKKSSVNYVFVFYRAMIIFARKHFSQKNARLFSFLINAAIYFRAGVAILNRFVKRAFLPAVDFSAVILLLYGLTHFWAERGTEFEDYLLKIAIPLYALIWLISLLFTGGYDKPIKLVRFLTGGLIGTAIILMGYALLPKEWQFSRLFILLGAAAVIAYFFLSRLALHFALGGRFDLYGNRNKNFVIVGSEKEALRVKDLLEHTNQKVNNVLLVSSGNEKESYAVGTINQLDQIVHIHKMDEIIFCAKDNTAQMIIEWMTKIDSSRIDFKIAQPDSLFIIGSNSIDSSGELYVFDVNSISKPHHTRNKRTLDVLLSFILLVLSPVVIWSFDQKTRYLRNLLSVLTGKRSFVGYRHQYDESSLQLPRIRPGILTPLDAHEHGQPSKDTIQKMNLLYARDYSWLKDLQIIRAAFRKLDS
jgi:O-antigen biosynthesis protein